MKRFLMLLLALAVALPCLAEAGDPFIGRWQDPYYGRALLEIAAEGEGYAIRITWGNSFDSEGVWEMAAKREGDRLVYTGGRMAIVTYSEGGAVIDEDVQYDDAEGAFTLEADGRLSWIDSREDRSSEFALERLEDAGAEAALSGGWMPSEDPAVTEEMQALFDRAMEGLVGVNYAPVAYLGSQLVAGTNHAFLAQATEVYPGAQAGYVLVYLYEDLAGNVDLMNIADLDIGAMCEY